MHAPTIAAALCLFASCAWSPRAELPRPPTQRAIIAVVASPPAPPLADAVVIVTIDGTRWQEVFTGTDDALAWKAHVRKKSAAELVPTLSRWMRGDGVAIGAPGHGEIHASGPNYVSLPGYTEILGGRTPTACQTNECDAVVEPTFLDDAASAFPGSVAVISSWESIHRAAMMNDERAMVSTGRMYARGIPEAWLARGRSANPWPGQGEYRPDEETAELALRVMNERRPRVTFVGLGDTDEHAHHGDYAGYLEALERADAFVAKLEATVPDGTTIIVTCDHGRATGFRDHGGAFPESGRVWLVAHGAGVSRQGIVDMSRSARLADVAPTARVLLGMQPDADVRAGAPIEAFFR